MDIFKKIIDTANEAVESASDKLGDLKDAALEKAAEIQASETFVNLKERAGDFYDKAQAAAAEAAAETKEEAGHALESGKGFWEKAKAFAEEKTEAVRDSLLGHEEPKV